MATDGSFIHRSLLLTGSTHVCSIPSDVAWDTAPLERRRWLLMWVSSPYCPLGKQAAHTTFGYPCGRAAFAGKVATQRTTRKGGPGDLVCSPCFVVRPAFVHFIFCLPSFNYFVLLCFGFAAGWGSSAGPFQKFRLTRRGYVQFR